MKIVKIPKKKKGKFRVIAVPSQEEKISFWNSLAAVNEKAEKFCSESVHGFMRGKSPVTNAMAHRGFKFTLSFDLEDFFDTVKPEHLAGKLKKEEISQCMPDGRAYQGLPTSPAIANLAAADIDKAIIKFIAEREIVYTRYADDLTFSFNDYSFYQLLKEEVNKIVSRSGFRLNKNKTRLQDSRFGRRGVTGVSVADDIKVSRRLKRKIRAAAHQKNASSLKGLMEWAKLKTPKVKGDLDYTQDKLDNLCRMWQIKPVKISETEEKEEEVFGNVIVTGDIPYILGPSNWSTNWKSCLQHPSGMNHKRTNFYPYARGARIAGLMSEEKTTQAGITRNKFRARTFVYSFRGVEGKFFCDKYVYGESDEAKNQLKKALEAEGFKPVSSVPAGSKVDGHAPASKLSSSPYGGSLVYVKAKGAFGRWSGKPVYFLKKGG